MTNLADLPSGVRGRLQRNALARTNAFTNEYLEPRRMGSSETGTVSDAPVTMLAPLASPPAIVQHPTDRHLPTIVKEILPRLIELSTLKPGWDSYGAHPVEPEAVTYLLNMLLAVKRKSLAVPQIVPMNSGGLQLEWDHEALHLEVAVGSQQACFYFEDEAAQATVSEDQTSVSDAADTLDRLLAHFPGSR